MLMELVFHHNGTADNDFPNFAEIAKIFPGKTGIGVDIENIGRFNRAHASKRNFLRKIFTEKELDYCYSKGNALPHLAVRFSGKEAVVKALSSVGIYNVPYYDIEIINGPDGSPSAKIQRKGFGNITISISLSHSSDSCIAFAIVNRQDFPQ
jgi:holo-[acyl-carrier protein] synthase